MDPSCHGPHGLHLNSFRAFSSQRESAAAQLPSFSSTLLQSQGFSNTFPFLCAGRWSPIYSLIFCTLKEAAKDSAEGDASSAAGVQARCHL